MLALINTAFVTTVAGIGWEPEIRGALVVLVGSVVLFGSVWLILTTNLGHVRRGLGGRQAIRHIRPLRR